MALLILTLAVMLLGGCKTTVKNYQDAYQVAQQKHERDEERHRKMQDELGVDRTKLQSVDEPDQLMMDMPDTDGEVRMQLPAKYMSFHRQDNVVATVILVAKFKMAANAEGLADDLRSEGFPQSRAVRSGDDYYVVLAEGSSLSEMSPTAYKFKKMLPDFPYVGIGEMTIAYPR